MRTPTEPVPVPPSVEPGRPEPALLQVVDLHIEFATAHGWVKVLDGVSLDIAPRQTIGLVGESGCGKSVTSLAIMGLIPTPPGRVGSGQVLFEGTDVLRGSRRDWSDVRGNDIAMVFQEPMSSLNPAFTVGEQIAETVRRHRGVGRRAAWRRAVEMLDIVGIPGAADRARRYPHEFSGGMRQRVMIAIALSCDPKLLIADEPTTALDVTIQAQILDLLRAMQVEFDLSVLFVTHDLGVVADICDRVFVMYAGQVIERASVDDIFDRPLHPYTEGLLGAMPRLTAEASVTGVVPGSPPLPWELPDGCRFEPRCRYALPACRDGVPPLESWAPGREARCIRSGELRLKGTT